MESGDIDQVLDGACCIEDRHVLASPASDRLTAGWSG